MPDAGQKTSPFSSFHPASVFLVPSGNLQALAIDFEILANSWPD
jgi:hypothetical protein